jgi:hypothetical protein
MRWLVCEVLSHGGEVPLLAGEAGSLAREVRLLDERSALLDDISGWVAR